MRFLTDKRLWIVAGLIGAVLALRGSGFADILSIDTLKAHRQTLTGFVARHAVLAALAFMAGYVVAVALSLPGALIMTLTGGFLFGPWLGTALNVTSATIGACLIFLFAQRLFGAQALDRFGERGRALADNIRGNAWSYLLVLRLVPLFPFFLVNLAPAFVGVKLPVFALTTFFGIIPGTAVYTSAGAGLGAILDRGGALDARAILTPEIIAGLVGLALLSLAAIPLKKRFAKG
jgi:uncharacterized membrane protein YdjX (TVP38/TMEM64 family)